MRNFLKNKSIITIETLQNKFFIHPSASQDEPGTDALIHGSIILDLKKPSEIEALTITLVGMYEITYQDPRLLDGPLHQVDGHTIERSLALGAGDINMAAGRTVFAFTIAIPANTAVHQKCSYGKVRHKLVAQAMVSGASLRTEKLIQLTATPTADASPPLPLALDFPGYLPELGLIRARFSSSYFTIGAPILTEVVLPCVPRAIEIVRVTLNVLQQIELTINGIQFKAPVQPWRCFLVDLEHPASLKMPATTPSTTMLKKPVPKNALPFKCLAEGEAFHFNHLARLPNDIYIRPTSLPGCETPIKVTHQLELDITFREPGDEIKFLVVKRKASIASCCCLLTSISLPQYSELPLVVKEPLFSCVCGLTVRDLIDENGKPIYGTHGEEKALPAPCGFKYAPPALVNEVSLF